MPQRFFLYALFAHLQINVLASSSFSEGFSADFATPSTHLIYGYHVGALPSGRKAREMLNYGVDPLYGEAHQGLGFRGSFPS